MELLNDMTNTVKLSYPAGATNVLRVSMNNIEYKALQFHFHAPSEHTVEGV